MRKRCPKCGGNILLSSDEHGWYEHCLQCSYTHDLEPVVVVARQHAAKTHQTVSRLPKTR
jgi:hypothetical protein